MTMDFNDRRDTVHPDAVRARLTSSPVRLKKVADGTHAVVHGGQEVGKVFTYPPTGDPLVGRYAIEGSGEIGFHSRARAARFAAAAHDVNQHRIGGFNQGHHDFIDGKVKPQPAPRRSLGPADVRGSSSSPSPREMQDAASHPALQYHPAAQNLSGATPAQARDLVAKHKRLLSRGK